MTGVTRPPALWPRPPAGGGRTGAPPASEPLTSEGTGPRASSSRRRWVISASYLGVVGEAQNKDGSQSGAKKPNNSLLPDLEVLGLEFVKALSQERSLVDLLGDCRKEGGKGEKGRANGGELGEASR